MADELKGKTIAFMMANEGVEQVELTTPWEAVRAAGAETVLVAPELGEVQAFNHLDKADVFEVNEMTGSVSIDEFDGLVLPGGVANPDRLRQDGAAVEFIRAWCAEGKPIAAICHAPWTLIEADVVRGRKVTSWPSLRTDLQNAGAQWVDEEVVVCDGERNVLVTSRKPEDLSAFSEAVIKVFAHKNGHH